MIAHDEHSKRLQILAKRVANSNAPIMLHGENGVGKEVCARYIHDNSDRKDNPFIAINCAAIPDGMMEDILFGHEKGAFTGACQVYVGKLEQANGGTLLLDEISEMSTDLQAKLLRVLQEKEMEKIGGRKTVKLDIRYLATTNRNLGEEVLSKRFRMDLYHRINVFPIEIQPLRKRPADIIPLAKSFLAREEPGTRISKPAKEILCNYDWPGNVRELNNVITRALILKTKKIITEEDIYLDSQLSGMSLV